MLLSLIFNLFLAPRPIPATRGSMLPAYITPQIGINSDEAFNTNNNYIQWSSIITDMNNPLLQISDPIECYQQAGAALILPTVRSQRIVHLANQIKLPEMDGENVKGSHQVLLDNNDSEWWKKVGPEFFTACNELLDALNLRKGRNFKFRETYLMANEPNRGEQCPHTDTADGPWCGHDGELVLFMYLDDGPSTEICIAPQRVFGDVAINVTEAKAIEMLQSLSDHCMRGVEVRAGSMMAMGMHLFHRGPLNRTGRLRRVLYTVYTANATGTRVQHAYYRWQMYGRLLGFSHPLTGAQLLIDSKFITWARLPPDSERDRTLTRMQSHYQKHIEDLEKLKTQQMSNEPPPHPRSPDIPAPSTPHPYNTRSRSPTPEPPPALIPPPSDETCRSLGLGIPGKPREPQQNAILLRHMYDIQSTTSDSYDKVVKKVAKIHLASPHNIRAIDNHYQQAQQLEREDGRNKPPHNYNKSIISLDMDIKMHRYLMEALQKNGCVTAKQLSALFEPTPPSESTVIRWLHENHYSWMMKSWMGSMNRAQMVRRVRDFIFKLARVIRLVNAGKAVIVGTDEAYVQQSLCTTKTWCPGPASGVNAGNASTGTGPECGARTNIIHAITEKGMLPGSGLLFEGTSKSQQSADYHTAYMGNDTWLKWLKDQLIPSFERAYPGKQMVLLLDNVNYHCVRGEDWITPSAANKKKCADFLRSKGINSISVTRKGENIVVSAEDYERPLKVTRDAVERDGKVVLVKRKPGAPIKDLRAAVTAYLKDHPQETEVQRIMREHNHILLHTPPFSPQAQPIEHLWKIVKGAVRKLYTLHRTQKQTQQQLEQALDNITPQQATGCFHRCMNWINIWIQQDEELSEYGQSIEELAQSAFIDDWRPYEGEDISTLIEDQQQAEQIEHENEDKIETESDENTPPDP